MNSKHPSNDWNNKYNKLDWEKEYRKQIDNSKNRKKSEINPVIPIIDFELDVVTVADNIVRTVVAKQKDYGANNIQLSPFGPLQGLLTRIYDKVARAVNLTKNNTAPNNESLRDTFVDLAGYAILSILVLDGRFPKEK